LCAAQLLGSLKAIENWNFGFVCRSAAFNLVNSMALLARAACLPVAGRTRPAVTRHLHQSRSKLASCRSIQATHVHVAAAAGSGSADQDAQLVATWQRYSKLLSASGSIQVSPDEPLNIFYIPAPQSDAGIPAPGLISLPLADSSSNSTNVGAAAAALQQLVTAAVPSPFGKGSETVYDPSVRTAAEIKAAQLALNKTLPPQEVGCPCKDLGVGASVGTWLLGWSDHRAVHA
jgi:hypothetical protein